MFITDAYAQAAGGLGGAGSGIVQFLPIVLVGVIIYMMMWRPQQKKMKAHREMIAAVKRGDRVVAAGGLIGVVSKVVDEGEVQLEIAEGVRIRVLRSSINEVLNRSEPAKGQDNTPAKPEKPEKSEKKG
jgi:preprotein translocase subunit YajC